MADVVCPERSRMPSRTQHSFKTPRVPNMMPRAGTNTDREIAPSTTISRSSRSAKPTMIKILKNRLGCQASLLDLLPVEKVEMVPQDEMSGYVPHKIKLGSEPNDPDNTLWVYLGTSVRAESLPELRISGLRPGPISKLNYTLDAVTTKAELREEFMPAISNKKQFTAVLKTYFVLKDAPLPSESTFSESFIRDVKRVCRRYQVDTYEPQVLETTENTEMSPTHSPEATFTTNLEDASPPKTRFCVRKSEQKGPFGQRYSLRKVPDMPLLSRKRPHAGSPSDTAAVIERGSEECFEPQSGNVTRDRRDPEDSHIREDVMRHKLQKRNYQVSEQGDESTSQMTQVSKSIQSMVPADPDSEEQGSAEHTVSSDVVAEAGSNAPISILRNADKGSPKETLEPVATVASTSPQIPSVPQGFHALAPNKLFDECLNLHSKLNSIEEEIETIAERRAKVDLQYHEQRQNMIHYIDVELPAQLKEKQRIEIQRAVDEVKAKCKAESDAQVSKLKSEYQGLEQEHKGALKAVDKEQNAKKQTKAALDISIKQKIQDLSKDDLWRLAIYAKSGGGKRSKTEDEKDKGEHDE